MAILFIAVLFLLLAYAFKPAPPPISKRRRDIEYWLSQQSQYGDN